GLAMQEKPVLMIHEVTKQCFSANINWENYVLTFDDCLFSQYYYWDFFKDFVTTKILFIPCSLIWYGHHRSRFNGEHIDSPTCEEALEKRVEDPYNYMTLSEIQEMNKLSPDLILGGHGFMHEPISTLDPVRRISIFEKDITLMMNWFQANFGSKPMYYCYPFNYDDIPAKNAIFDKHHITRVFGSERIDLKDLL
ncbi:MAG: hypothetical protein R3250_11225, partial [Melioribacteraceae bacterium]|nr:hypothetical protein [Melioribacteraceae bacterium]